LHDGLCEQGLRRSCSVVCRSGPDVCGSGSDLCGSGPDLRRCGSELRLRCEEVVQQLQQGLPSDLPSGLARPAVRLQQVLQAELHEGLHDRLCEQGLCGSGPDLRRPGLWLRWPRCPGCCEGRWRSSPATAGPGG